jgi:serine phosphatase RsbU (regulator of sigma subunit)
MLKSRIDRVLLFTDGVTEVRNSSGEEFGEPRLIEVMRRNRLLGAYNL